MVDLSDFQDLLGDNIPLEDKLQGVLDLTPLYTDEGYSGAGMLADLRENGFKIQTQLFYLERRIALGQQNEYEAIGYFPSTYTPTDLDFGVNDGNQTEPYKFIYRVEHTNDNTGETYYTEFGIETDGFSTIRDINNSGLDFQQRNYPGNQEETISVSVFKGFRKS